MPDVETARESRTVTPAIDPAQRCMCIRKDLAEYFKEYARQKPGAVALWCLGVGFVIGWKLKPW